ncbi:MAG: FAD-binding protein [Planctomycetaceae bacterium]|jgi:flavin-dependent dehydrogenase|nr:FAD-binding protein [Planctomycetaceae bacterium]
MYDIGIIGAGPAGATLARLAAKNHRVLLLNSGREKCCGGILAPEAQKILAQLNLSLPKKVLVDPQPFAVTVMDAKSNLIRHYSRQYVNINRHDFDQWLLSMLPDSVDVRFNAIYKKAEINTTTNKSNDTITVHFNENGKQQTEKVKLLVGADGAASAVRRQFFKSSSKLKKYVAFQDWYDNNEITFEANSKSSNINFFNNYVGIFDNEITDFYCWTIPKDNQILIGGAIPFLPDARNRFENFKTYLNSIGLKIGQVKKHELCLILRPMATSAINLGTKQVMLIGEAAGLISPTSAEGISTALASAIALAKAINSNKNNLFNEYKKNTKNIIRSIKLKYLKNPAMFNPYLRKLIMKFGFTALDK